MPDIDGIVRLVDGQLEDMARSVIRRHLDPGDDATVAFERNPDGREQHQTQWHQWGIITHTRMFLRHFDKDIPTYLREWGMWDAIDGHLSVLVDGVPRWKLLRLSVLLHDIGKFGARTRGRSRFHFAHHESLSGSIIRNEMNLRQYDLTVDQVEYVARTAEDHFVLGVVRKRARDRGSFSVSFTRSDEFRAIADDIKRAHSDDYPEIGILFLGDSLAKADPQEGPELALTQNEVNIAVARRYLELVLENSPL